MSIIKGLTKEFFLISRHQLEIHDRVSMFKPTRLNFTIRENNELSTRKGLQLDVMETNSLN